MHERRYQDGPVNLEDAAGSLREIAINVVGADGEQLKDLIADAKLLEKHDHVGENDDGSDWGKPP